ncbi:MAG TPA: pitrilysin family protein [Oscillospiraceae bacterium]|nr:pitrilysin family protein [Oscillospiraceae bacterium]
MAIFKHKRLENGINVYIHPTAKFKTILVQLFFHRQLLNDEVTQSALLPAILQRGTGTYPTRQKLALRLEELYGTELMSEVIKKGERQLICYTMDLVHDQFLPEEHQLLRKGLEILHDLLTNPLLAGDTFKADYVEQEKEQHEKVINGLINDKIAYSVERCLQEMCAEEPFSVFKYGSLEQLGKLDATSLFQFYQTFLQESPVDLHIIGDLNVEETFALVQKIFTYQRGTEKKVPPTKVAVQPREVSYIRDEMDVSQGKLVLGYRTGLHYGDDDYAALVMYNGILGTFPHSKLFQNVREKASLAYYTYSRLEKHKGLMVISSGIETNNYERTLEIINQQVSDMQKGEFSQADVDNTRSGLRNQYLVEEDHPGALINRTVDGILAERVFDTKDLLARLNAVTRDDIVRIAEKIALDTVYFLTKGGV